MRKVILGGLISWWLLSVFLFVGSLHGANLTSVTPNYKQPDGTKIPISMLPSDDGNYSISMGINGVTISERALDVHVKSIHSNLINTLFHEETATFTNFDGNVSAGDRNFTVVSGAGFLAGDFIQIENSLVETNLPTIIAIAVNTIEIDRPLDMDYNASDGIRKVNVNMAVDGSVTAVAFRVQPETNTVVETHLTRILFSMIHPTAGDMGKFGNLPALTRGLVLRFFDGVTGQYRTLANWKTNADIKLAMYDVVFDDRSGGGGDFGTSGRGTLSTSGGIVILRPGSGDLLEFLVQDDLTLLDLFYYNAQGHLEN